MEIQPAHVGFEYAFQTGLPRTSPAGLDLVFHFRQNIHGVPPTSPTTAVVISLEHQPAQL